MWLWLFGQAQASKTRDVIAQQRVVILLAERLKVATAPIAAAKAKRDKVQGFLRVRLCLPDAISARMVDILYRSDLERVRLLPLLRANQPAWFCADLSSPCNAEIDIFSRNAWFPSLVSFLHYCFFL